MLDLAVDYIKDLQKQVKVSNPINPLQVSTCHYLNKKDLGSKV
jgi:hypothetical protein